MDVELMEKLGLQLAFEHNQAESLKPVVDATNNRIVKMFLNRIMLDSIKHANMLQALIDLNADKIVWHVDKQRMLKDLKYHIQTEEKMLEGITSILDKVEGLTAKPLLQEILSDEKRHHRILTQLFNIVESIDVSKEDWVDLYRKRLQEEWPGF